MPLYYSHFKSFSNKISRIFIFKQLLFTKLVKLTCKGQEGLGLSGEGRQGANMGWVSSVMSKEAPIPPAPGCEAAQPNHVNPKCDRTWTLNSTLDTWCLVLGVHWLQKIFWLAGLANIEESTWSILRCYKLAVSSERESPDRSQRSVHSDFSLCSTI